MMNHDFEQLTGQIKHLLTQKEYVLLAIDGRCAAGKTTLSAQLQEMFPCTVLHMDDFFLTPAQRTPERLAEPGGNVDRERFAAEVLEPLCAHCPFLYRRFDCATQTFLPPVEIVPQRLTVVEGAYACHPELREAYDLRVFLDIDAQTQFERLRRRSAEKLQMFLDRWIPLEEAYFAAFSVRENCDLLLRLC